MRALPLLLAVTLAACGHDALAPAPDASITPDAAPAATSCTMDPDRALIGTAVAPSVLPTAGGYQMIYGGFSYLAGTMFTTTSTDGVTWSPAVMDPQRQGFYLTQVAYPGDTRALFYTPTGPTQADEQTLWMATSTAGGPWTGDVEILGPPAWAPMGIERPTVVYARGRYWLFYTGYGTRSSQIGLATSDDGRTWTAWPEPVISPGPSGQFDDTNVSLPGVVFDGQRFHLFYAGTSGQDRITRIGVATSTDGVHWDRQATPALVPTPGQTYTQFGFLDSDPLIEGDHITLWVDTLAPGGIAAIARARCPR